MKVINLYAGPGSGKSTTAAYIFSYLKNNNCNVELVREFAKDIVYEKSDHVLNNQIYVTGHQYKRLRDIMDYGVKLVITDSPLLLGLIYCKSKPYFTEYSELLKKLNSEFQNINVFVKRTKPYNPSGRLQTVEESDDISNQLKSIIKFDYEIDGTEDHQRKFSKILHDLYSQEITV